MQRTQYACLRKRAAFMNRGAPKRLQGRSVDGRRLEDLQNRRKARVLPPAVPLEPQETRGCRLRDCALFVGVKMPAAAAKKEQREIPSAGSRGGPRSRRDEPCAKPEARKRLASCAQKARSLQRLLEHKQHDLPEEVQARMRAEAETLQKRHRLRVKELKRQKFIRSKKALYSKLKFYELKKVQRRLQQTRKELLALMSEQEQGAVAPAAGRPLATSSEDRVVESAEALPLEARISQAQQKLRLHLEDLNYIRLYPEDAPYVALFPAQDSEESQKKRQEMRRRILELMLESRKGPAVDEEDEAAGEDMFVDASDEAPDGAAAAATADPFEDARALSDEEKQTQQQRRGGKAFRYGANPQNGGIIRGSNGRAGASHVLQKGGKHERRWTEGEDRLRGGNENTQRQKRQAPGKGASVETQRERQEAGCGRTAEKGIRAKRDPLPQKKPQQQRDATDKARAKDPNNQPTRIGLSKHKAPNQHVMFDSDEENSQAKGEIFLKRMGYHLQSSQAAERHLTRVETQCIHMEDAWNWIQGKHSGHQPQPLPPQWREAVKGASSQTFRPLPLYPPRTLQINGSALLFSLHASPDALGAEVRRFTQSHERGAADAAETRRALVLLCMNPLAGSVSTEKRQRPPLHRSHTRSSCHHLSTLHNGTIQLWDYRIGSLVDRFDEHEGPVRGIDFHASQPLFVSGGDDYQIKLWNLLQRKCIFTFSGHLDYIRTTFFHNIYPWILSASDDQTVRIWNWQSRVCVAVLTGHTHYVMCARFHPTEDLVVSASLDQTLRLWDTSGLRERSGGMAGPVGRSGSRSSAHADIFAATDAVCKFVLEGHERGVNWAAFHPSLPLIASAADDKLIKLWRYNAVKAWEVDTLRGHSNNVSCLVFHPHRDLLLSNSEDRSIRVWDVTRRTCLHTFRRDTDRFWVLAAHPTSGALAAGHDGGLVVFKIATERPPSCMWTASELVFVAERRLCWIDTAAVLSQKLHEQQGGPQQQQGVQQSQLEVMLAELQRPLNALASGPKYILCNPLNAGELQTVAVYAEGEGLTYDFYCGPRSDARGAPPAASSLLQVAQGTGQSFAFIARNKLAVLEAAPNGSCLRILTAPSVRASSLAGSSGASSVVDAGRIEALPVQTEKIFFAGSNKLLLLGDDKAKLSAECSASSQLFLYDLPVRRLSPPLQLALGGPVRTVSWDAEMRFLALTSKHAVILLRADFGALSSAAPPAPQTEAAASHAEATPGRSMQPVFKILTSVHENIRVKGGVWDAELGGFIYATLSNVKFCLPSGDRGIICSLSESIYVVKVSQQHLMYLDRRSQLLCKPLASNEYLFKVALNRRDYMQVRGRERATISG
ncbi:coatomer alpha [Cyclospora cayetanensis]|uniref:Coatomer alpha n=1 Tax=Cyclospora cayetanensis TaxID=88456 RepID=A0A1D3D8I9_9EIME|nr:coatomer alpha [Cyclospora cayetanensis]